MGGRKSDSKGFGSGSKLQELFKIQGLLNARAKKSGEGTVHTKETGNAERVQKRSRESINSTTAVSKRKKLNGNAQDLQRAQPSDPVESVDEKEAKEVQSEEGQETSGKKGRKRKKILKRDKEKEASKALSLFLGRCPDGITEEHIKSHYSSLKEEEKEPIKSITWGKDKDGEFKGYCIVKFESSDLVARAVAMDPPMVFGRGLVVSSQAEVPKDHATLVEKFRQSGYTKGSHPLPPVVWSAAIMKSSPFQKKMGGTIKRIKRSSEEVQKFYADNRIEVPAQCPEPILTFGECQFGPKIMTCLQANFKAPLPVQCVAWPCILAGRDALILSQTGTGKTLAYIIPILVHLSTAKRPKAAEGMVALVMAPTRELTQQIQQQFLQFHEAGIRVAIVHGGSEGEGDKLKQAAPLQRGVDVVVATPGRLLEFGHLEVVKFNKVTFVVLDEADHMLYLGLAPAVNSILRTTRPDRQTVMFSATWADNIRELAGEHLVNPLRIVLNEADQAAVNKNVEQRFIAVERQEQKLPLLKKLLGQIRARQHYEGGILIFSNAKDTVNDLVRKLGEMFDPVIGIHSDYDQIQREQALKQLKQSGNQALLIATDVAARGLDVQGLGCVINFDMPKKKEIYCHRIGRTGRVHDKGLAYSMIHVEKDEAVFKGLKERYSHVGSALVDHRQGLQDTLVEGNPFDW